MTMCVRAQTRVETLQDSICDALERIDGAGRFEEDLWTRPSGGGGRTRVMAKGQVFEKAGVNVSAVFGPVPEALKAQMPGDGETFFATGISLVLHPLNPHIPTTHANYRYIERGSVGWFGGGADLTPYVLYEEDAVHFHQALKKACDGHDPRFYPAYKAWCDQYFYLPHRGEARGIGGIFFDHVWPGALEPIDVTHSMESLYDWWHQAGDSFIDAYLPIVERRRDMPWDDALRAWQLMRRGRYVEFNLMYDRGTIFGLKTNGRVESILMSLPPEVQWQYDAQPEPNTYQSHLLEVLRQPREWA